MNVQHETIVERREVARYHVAREGVVDDVVGELSIFVEQAGTVDGEVFRPIAVFVIDGRDQWSTPARFLHDDVDAFVAHRYRDVVRVELDVEPFQTERVNDFEGPLCFGSLRPLDVVLDEADALIAELDECYELGESGSLLSGSLLSGPDFDELVDKVAEPVNGRRPNLGGVDLALGGMVDEENLLVVFRPFPSCFRPSNELVGMRVRFVEDYSTGVLPDGGPTAPAGWESEVEEVDPDGPGVLVRVPFDDGTVRQYVPTSVVGLVSGVRS